MAGYFFSSRKRERISLKFRFVRYDFYSRRLQYSTSQQSFGKLFKTLNLQEWGQDSRKKPKYIELTKKGLPYMWWLILFMLFTYWENVSFLLNSKCFKVRLNLSLRTSLWYGHLANSLRRANQIHVCFVRKKICSTRIL